MYIYIYIMLMLNPKSITNNYMFIWFITLFCYDVYIIILILIKYILINIDQ